ncbi:MAG: pyridoxamine 5'-phosphate oxidase family protein [Bauldia sp.]
MTGGLATLSADGAPFASLVQVATTAEGEPILLLSALAVHTRNLARDPRASLLLVAPGGEGGDPLAGARLSVSGTIGVDADAASRQRFLARHGEAETHAGLRRLPFPSAGGRRRASGRRLRAHRRTRARRAFSPTALTPRTWRRRRPAPSPT